MVLRGPISRNHEIPNFLWNFLFSRKNWFSWQFQFLMKSIRNSWKLRFCENGGFPEVSVACRFLDNLRGFRVRRENHEIQHLFVILTEFHLTPGLWRNERQGRHAPMPSSRFSLFAEIVVIHVVFSRGIHPNLSFLWKHWVWEEIPEFHEITWNFMKFHEFSWNSTYFHGHSCTWEARSPPGTLKTSAKAMVLGGAGERGGAGAKGDGI